MLDLWLIGIVQSVGSQIKKYRQRKIEALGPHFVPPPLSDKPLPTTENSSFVYKISTKISKRCCICFAILSVLSMIVMSVLMNSRVFVDSETLVEIPLFGVSFGFMGAIFSGMRYLSVKNYLYCVGPEGIVSKRPSNPTIVLRWVEVHALRAESGRLQIEMYDRSKSLIICPNAGKKETARMICSQLSAEKYMRAEQLLRGWQVD